MFTVVSHDVWLDVGVTEEDDISPSEFHAPSVDLRMQI